jgi:hypothetical protein
MVSTSRPGISWPCIGWYRQVRIDAYGVASSHPLMEMSDIGPCRECPHLRGRIQTLTQWHRDTNTRYLSARWAMMAHVCSDWGTSSAKSPRPSTDLASIQRPIGFPQWRSMRRSCADFHMKFFEMDSKRVSSMRPNIRCPRKRHDSDPLAILRAVAAARRRLADQRTATRTVVVGPRRCFYERAGQSERALSGCPRKARSRSAKAPVRLCGLVPLTPRWVTTTCRKAPTASASPDWTRRIFVRPVE